MSKLSAFSGKLTDSGFCQNSVTAIIHVDSSTGKKGNCEEGVFFFYLVLLTTSLHVRVLRVVLRYQRQRCSLGALMFLTAGPQVKPLASTAGKDR